MGIYKETKEKLLQVRITEDEQYDLEDQAKEAGYKFVSEYVRSKLFEGEK